MCAFLYTCILTSSGSRALVDILASSGLCVNMFLIRMNNCILATLSSLVLGNCASQSVNNLQILTTGQAFVLEFYRTSRKICRKEPLRADLNVVIKV